LIKEYLRRGSNQVFPQKELYAKVLKKAKHDREYIADKKNE